MYFFQQGAYSTALLIAAVRGLRQDIIGEAATAAAVHEHWVDWRISLPIEILALAFAVYIIVAAVRRSYKEEHHGR